MSGGLFVHSVIKLKPSTNSQKSCKNSISTLVKHWLNTNDRHQCAHTVTNAHGHPLCAQSSHYAVDGPRAYNRDVLTHDVQQEQELDNNRVVTLRFLWMRNKNQMKMMSEHRKSQLGYLKVQPTEGW